MRVVLRTAIRGEKKSDGDAENRHQDSIEKRGRNGVARLRRTETLVIGNYYAALRPVCKADGVALCG